MNNVRNFGNHIDFKLYEMDYWDFMLSGDGTRKTPQNPAELSGSCLTVWYDFSNTETFTSSGTTNGITSLVDWDSAVNTGYTFPSYGLTGLDNGAVMYVRPSGDTQNSVLLSALTATTLVIQSGTTAMSMTAVSGNTGQYVYPMHMASGATGEYMQLCGGFYQGFYKIDGSTYEVLPSRYNGGWTVELWLNPNNLCTVSGQTLNDIYPDNKGFFFYIGTRAENKFWNVFNGLNTGCTSGCTQPSGCTDTVTQGCTIPRETDIAILDGTGFGIPVSPPRVNIDLITNNFLIYGRAQDYGTTNITGTTGSVFNINDVPSLYTHNGLGTKLVCTYDGNGIPVATVQEWHTNNTNPFLIYGRANTSGTGSTCNQCCGPMDGLGNQTICTFSGLTEPATVLDRDSDVADNALGFRIKDDGSIGYRYLTYTGVCDNGGYGTGLTMVEGYSMSGAVSANTWSHIAVRFVTNYLDDCTLAVTKRRRGRLMFYVNSKLKYVVDDFPEFIAKGLVDHHAKQVGVPFNMSVGGGTQGLLESQTFDGQDPDDIGLAIERYFAGSFIGGISEFRFNICDIGYEGIRYDYLL